MAALLVLATVAAYWPALHHEFLLYDDAGYVTDNLRVHDGLTIEGVRWALTTGAMANWHPLTWLSYLLDASLFGLDPGRMHAINVALHLRRHRVRFVLVGGVAAVVEGAPVSTFDLDIVHARTRAKRHRRSV